MSKNGKANGKAALRQYMLRVPEVMFQRVERQAGVMRRQTGLAISLAEVLRKCVSLGLAQLERGK